MEAWDNFFVAVAGASAALVGLIFVGVSISFSYIIANAKLPSRASEAITLLMATLIVSTLCLVPDQPLSLLGIELLIIGCFIWIVILKIDIRVYKMTNIKYKKQYLRNIIYGQLATLPYIAAGAGILLGGSVYLYLLVPGIIFSFIKAVTDAWVLLIEIHR